MRRVLGRLSAPVMFTLALSAAGLALAEEILVSVDASDPSGAMSSWFEPSMFAAWNPAEFVQELMDDAGGQTGGMVRLNVETELAASTSLAEYALYLDIGPTNAKVGGGDRCGRSGVVDHCQDAALALRLHGQSRRPRL